MQSAGNHGPIKWSVEGAKMKGTSEETNDNKHSPACREAKIANAIKVVLGNDNEITICPRRFYHVAFDHADYGHVEVEVDRELFLRHTLFEVDLFQVRAEGNEELSDFLTTDNFFIKSISHKLH